MLVPEADVVDLGKLSAKAGLGQEASNVGWDGLAWSKGMWQGAV